MVRYSEYQEEKGRTPRSWREIESKIETYFGHALRLDLATLVLAFVNLFMYIYPVSTVQGAKNFLGHATDINPGKLIIANMVISPWPCMVSAGLAFMIQDENHPHGFVTGVHAFSSVVLAILGSLSMVAYGQNGVDGLIGLKTNTTSTTTNNSTLESRRNHYHSHSNVTYVAANDDGARTETAGLWIACAILMFINAILLAASTGIFTRMHIIRRNQKKAELQAQEWPH